MKNRIMVKVIILLINLYCLFGCALIDDRGIITENLQSVSDDWVVFQSDDEIFSIMQECKLIYEEVCDKKNENAPNYVEEIIGSLGKKGYVAVDIDNQFDMVCPEKLESFIKQAKNEENAHIFVFNIFYSNRFTLYEMVSENGQVYICQRHFVYEEMELKETASSEYAAVVFDYTPEGYLMIEGYWRSQESYVLTLSDEEEHIALRFAEDGSFQYLGNKILNDGIKNIPDYQYRIYEE